MNHSCVVTGPLSAIFRVAIPLLMVAAAAPVAALIITPKWDSSLTSQTNAAAIESAFTAVINDYDSVLTAPVHVYVNVGWDEVGGHALPSGAIGASMSNLYGYFSYAQVKSWLPTSDVLPATTPSGVSQYVVTSADAKALGIVYANQTSADGYIGFGGSTSQYGFTAATVTSSVYDFSSVAAHELAEVLGQLSGAGNNTWRSALDLFRYSSPGTLSYSSTQAAYFSLDGGKTDLHNYNNATSGDRGDWATTSTSLDARDAFIAKGQHKSITGVDLAALDAIGWGSSYLGTAPATLSGTVFTLSSVPEPMSWATMVVGFAFAGGALRRRRQVTVLA